MGRGTATRQAVGRFLRLSDHRLGFDMAYRITSTPLAREQARQLLLEARIDGDEERFSQALVVLHAEIADAPHDRGDLKYHTPMGYPVYSASRMPAAVNYSVYDEHQAVCITKVTRLGN